MPTRHVFNSPFYPTESQEEDVIQEEDTAELKLDKLEDEIANLSPDSSDGEEETHFMVLNRQNGNKSVCINIIFINSRYYKIAIY